MTHEAEQAREKVLTVWPGMRPRYNNLGCNSNWTCEDDNGVILAQLYSGALLDADPIWIAAAQHPSVAGDGSKEDGDA